MEKCGQIRVSLYTEETLMRDGTISALSRYEDLRVSPLGYATEADVLLAIVPKISERIVRLVDEQQKKQAEFKSVLIADAASELMLRKLMDYGVSGFFLRERCSYQDVVRAIRLAHCGETQILSAAMEMIARTDDESPSATRPISLTARETAVLRLFADGGDTALVAKKLSCSQRTIKGVSQSIIQKLGASNRTHAVAEGIRTGFL
ncbi:response regulator transcription factor [Streptomyces sp. NPDC096934]|uniref:helix-turn-helix transcriptional regulator n=1 Tax=Streptomyces sp. NPDC096934 TaxID=3155551 RepID=UPI0033186B48